jgi:hypothetical protein
MTLKYIAHKNGKFRQRGFLVESTGAEDAGRPVALGADGRLDASVLPTIEVPEEPGVLVGFLRGYNPLQFPNGYNPATAQEKVKVGSFVRLRNFDGPYGNETTYADDVIYPPGLRGVLLASAVTYAGEPRTTEAIGWCYSIGEPFRIPFETDAHPGYGERWYRYCHIKPLGTVNDRLSGLTPGQRYWLNNASTGDGFNCLRTTPLPDTQASTSSSTYFNQYLGVAISETELATVSAPITIL